MASSNNCPLCEHVYADERTLQVHLEVNHRKSELATFVVAHHDQRATPPASLPS
ncbi:hypothetical protein [Natronobeatus ordinarius]|uniref:hypothetical protein n=1 Tax=Natronobeatus ordinarius TaxID=2963433 RepID=UPI0020CDB91B|nr:hypothetical protein [Natronobeatus ordinarius]